MSILEGRRVLLVEDESLVAMLAEDMLLDLGCEVVVAMRLDQALRRLQVGDFDAAVLDVNLGETRSYPVADQLFERCIPFLFATGYGSAGLEPAYQAVPVMQKPYQKDQLEAQLRHLLTCETVSRGADSGARVFTCGCALNSKDPGAAQIRAD
ncbi:response regulator [Methylobacterium sp. Leaf93]|uniref:response regulator n=1 Tax=Methylobacterium sp. Leaf93 TaxID=1736249 RepID=UPI0006F68D57|nr:response regulator [Methylobacterium sp. Leaf93]KQP00996.1 transcriptional regulator [Methylobacterium sp. Leaf93]